MKETYFDPKPTKYPFPKDTSKHYIKIDEKYKINFDDKYPYIDKRKSFVFKQKFILFLLRTLAMPLSRIRLGLKIKGRKNIKENKELIKKGIISCSNHVHFWDYISILDGIRPYKPYYLVWDKNIRDKKNSKIIRLTKGIPIPDNIYGTKKFISVINDYLKNGGFLHIYPEGSMWEFYAPIRPLKRGIAHFAIVNDKPILPMAYSYRKPNWIRRHIFRQLACFTLNIGKPIFVNKELKEELQEDDLLTRCHKEMCILTNIDPNKNIYGPIYNNSTRVDYY